MTWYEVSVVSENLHGTSLPSYNLRVLTHARAANKTAVVHPVLPDVVGCCSDKGVKHYRWGAGAVEEKAKRKGGREGRSGRRESRKRRIEERDGR